MSQRFGLRSRQVYFSVSSLSWRYYVRLAYPSPVRFSRYGFHVSTHTYVHTYVRRSRTPGETLFSRFGVLAVCRAISTYILTLRRVNGNERQTHTKRRRGTDNWGGKKRRRERDRGRAEKREFHEMYPPMSGAARERASDVRSITDEPDVHAPKRRRRRRRRQERLFLR